ncbi:MAG: tyrosine-type recombinase/integrase [Lentisphaerae bacterium]|jgi:integrase|nr:tyrosine-type recombinase/integrase [Lentisphaerota bacterium]MBT5612833.1 tyrosine-type recombinase/integrase [Lentisphaerota bacterium]MBT7059841.1 tyrosine-type recombinase/integrase [Lentisphaerota bacterium]MBT7846079.1 tyrosine-type recombinase/integrase [Lentisphaerota bacterium]
MAYLVRRKGTKKWYIQWWDRDRKSKRVKATGTEDESKARERLAEFQAVLKGRHQRQKIEELLNAVGYEATTGVPLGQLWGLYVRTPKLRRTTDKTERAKLNTVANWIRWMEREHPEVELLHEVTLRTAARYFAWMASEGIHAQTRNNRLATLRVIWRTIQIPAGLPTNVWEGVPRVEANSERVESLTLEQVRAVYRTATEFESRNAEPGFWGAAVALAYHTGLREGDICELHSDEFSITGDKLCLVENKKWKGAQALEHPVLPEWSQHLPDRAEGYVWPTAAEAYKRNARWLSADFGKILKQAGIERKRVISGKQRTVVTFHSLRATYATIHRDQGGSLDDVRETLGHATIQMTQHYSHSHEAAKRLAEVRPSLTTEGEPTAQHD